MCTVTLHRGVNSYLVTMNRDELRSRGPEAPPVVESSGDYLWLGPRDEHRGGTWIGVNHAGVCACLLNANVSLETLQERIRPGMRTRGDIVPMLMAHGNLAQACRFVECSLNLDDFPPFMVLINSLEGARVYTYEGAGALTSQRLTSNWSLVTSSNWQTDDVLERRLELFHVWEGVGCPHMSVVPLFNLVRMPEGETWSPLMEREHSTTRSITQVSLQMNEAPLMRYSPVREMRVDLEDFTFAGNYSGSQ